ncbi:laminin beta [Chamberlinius hualienensis]
MKISTFYPLICYIFCFSLLQDVVVCQRRNSEDANPFQGSGTCEQGSCYPATGNLLVGREGNLTSTSTCGLYKPERFCIVSHLQDRKKCFTCDSRQTDRHIERKHSHRIENIVSKPGRRKDYWWQSENGVESASIQLDLEAEFHFTHLIMTFKTFRPAAMLIERSYDFGKTWRVYRHFAYDCAESFPNVPVGSPKRITDVVCESRYSSVAPSSGGEVIYRVLQPNIHISDPYTEEVQNLLKMTNLRINFTKLHTLGDDLVDNRGEIKEKYYYAIYDMVVRGSCSCYGHAMRCIALPGVPPRPDMVHGRCECTHNTKGLNCEQCEEFFNDLPWRPAFRNRSNACQKCVCHDHASKCHFDPAVYESTGRISGGVCDDCEHNTMGRNCEQCRPFFYQEPGRRLEDPDICRQCDCDPQGSLDEGICDSVTDSKNGLAAGKCHCKLNVDGDRCDRCKNGFWNFLKDNPNGCDSCSCDAKGTVANLGCNQYTGECTCKRYVIGRDCNQCMAEHWGLSDDRDGCKPCDCDPGGSRDNNCDVITGQCRCRPHVTGRRCEHPEQGYFAGLLDYLTYEAEHSQSSQTSQIVVKEPYGDRENTWTGLGFLKVYQDSYIEFIVDNIQTSMDYDVVIRYEPQLPGRWEDVKVYIERPGGVDIRGPCGHAHSSDDIQQVQLPSNARHVTLPSPVCLEGQKTYKVRVEFRQYESQLPTPTATLYIDSISLLPRADSIPFFQEGNGSLSIYRKQEYERFQCAQAFASVIRGSIPEVCKAYLFSIGIYTFGEAFECTCDLTGSVSSICDPLGGQCQCKPNIVGRKCDRCSPATYGFSPTGCTPCDCNSVGALDNFCNATTGKCNCRPNTYGRQCDECRPGYWSYPNCRPCECNGHADRCEPRTGYCIDCRDYTSGAHCDVCENGFFGDPRSGFNIPCRPCPCPGVLGEGHNFGATCLLDARTQNVICNCQEGYAGDRCDRCANNYYGNPEVSGGQCQQCQCNNNIDLTRLANCDAKTGECRNCLFNTEGFHCEKCKPGHWGDAINQNCIECTCDILGTDISVNSGYCDQSTGQCPCFPNVMGLNCDRCLPNHWKLASGMGCEACACDSFGSYAEQCNEFDGQCSCKPGFGGRKCDQCQTNFWGNPKEKCHPCECDRGGSETLQCNRENGSCICRVGIGGPKCDRCARGYTGQAPYCSPCGECFDNWDLILQGLKEEALRLIDEAKQIKRSGVTGVYTEQFADMQAKLDQVEAILAQANVTNVDIEELLAAVEQVRKILTDTEGKVHDLDKEIDNTTQRIYDANQQLNSLQNQARRLQEDAKELENNATALQEENVEGALNITRDAWRRSKAAQAKVNGAEETLKESERERKRTEGLIDRAQQDFNRTYGENVKALDEISDKINSMENEIPLINQDVCDGKGDPCDSLCGGAGCGQCGGLSCGNGAVTKADNALQLAKDADATLKQKDQLAGELLANISKARTEADKAKVEAQKAYDKALAVNNRSGELKGDVDNLIGQITEFLEDDNAKPQEIQMRADETLEKGIKLRPEEITNLAKQINDTIASLTNIDQILAETADDLARAQALKKQADDAKKDAEDVFNTAKKVAKALEDAKDAQDKAKAAIDKANDDINNAEANLAQIGSESEGAQEVANKSADDLIKLKAKLDELKKKFAENENDIQRAGKAADEADKLAIDAKRAADELENKYGRVSKALEEKANANKNANELAGDLRERADALAQSAEDKLAELQQMENEFMDNEIKLDDLRKLLAELDRQMMDSMAVIDTRAKFYMECTP